METLAFGYHLLMQTDHPAAPAVNVIAVAYSSGPTQAVIWDRRAGAWGFRPDVAAAILYSDPGEHNTRSVDRATAERAALEFTTVPLPTEEELTEICRLAGPWRGIKRR
ncbi:hypothetical protein ACFFWC_28195 [Plantactinospora siamensis]|uniref:Uncharacterized protein n=1 Tax=Plantactinospora siamensis TaxID=555372 RepID=A0ABV6NS18_9ACTN